MSDLQTISNELLLLEDRYNALIKDYQETQNNAEEYKNEWENLNKVYKNEIAKSISQDKLLKDFKIQNSELESLTIKQENELNNKLDEINELNDKVKAYEEIIEQQLVNKSNENDNENKDNNNDFDMDDDNDTVKRHKKKNSIIFSVGSSRDTRKFSFVQLGAGYHGRGRTMSVGVAKVCSVLPFCSCVWVYCISMLDICITYVSNWCVHIHLLCWKIQDLIIRLVRFDFVFWGVIGSLYITVLIYFGIYVVV